MTSRSRTKLALLPALTGPVEVHYDLYDESMDIRCLWCLSPSESVCRVSQTAKRKE